MKKIFVTLLIITLSISLFSSFTFANCSPDLSSDYEVGEILDDCLANSELIKGDDVEFDGGFGEQIKLWVNNISIYLGIFAVGSIVFGALMMTLSAGEEEKIKKAKDIVKWGIIGFIGLISVSAIINLVVKIMYSI